MQACVLREDRDMKKYGFKVLVKANNKVKSWDPKKTLLQRLDRNEQIDGSEFGWGSEVSQAKAPEGFEV